MTRTILSIAFLTVPALGSVAMADDGTSLSAAQTSYTGATMLVGDEDVAFSSVGVGSSATAEHLSTYGYFAGNTLYAGVEDLDGNAVDAIVEFFWFESSVDRGSDFYVAIVKARTTPADDFVLDHCDGWSFCDGPAVAVYSDSDTSTETGAFRWDWSLPFDDYGIDAVGEVTLTSSYGIGAGAEGSALYKKTYDEDGNKVEGDVQAKGYVNTEYKVQTQYQVTLYEWDVEVEGNNSKMDWEVILNNDWRAEENAYHEFFLVMQVEEGETFSIEDLEIAGTVDGGWFSGGKILSVGLEDIQLGQPEYEETDESGTDDSGYDCWYDSGDEWSCWDDWIGDRSDGDDDDSSGTAELTELVNTADEGNETIEVSLFGCSSAPTQSTPKWVMLAGLIGMLGFRRRRE